MTRLLVASVAMILLASSFSYAQNTRSLSVDLSVGLSTGSGGRYSDRSGVAGEITLVPAHATAGIVALTLGGEGSIASGDVCVLDAGPGTRCLSQFPATAHLGVLGGLEGRVSGVTLRMLGGPAFYGGAGASGMGSQFQLDASTGATHVAVLIAARGSLIRRFSGETQWLSSVAIGLRFQ